ncbi:hypothetical protein JM84_1939 [Dokdonia sp. Hel_I_63]|nr:hypothetical protein JM84_1939 [Dokdonia sp. Hel_I_63]
MKNIREFEFGKIQIEENFVIGIMKEGSHVDRESNQLLLSFCKDYFNGKSFGYISHRLNSYSVDPTVYMDAGNHPGLKAIAVVIDNPLIKSNVALEKQFYNQPFESFYSVEDAKEWLSKLLVN